MRSVFDFRAIPNLNNQIKNSLKRQSTNERQHKAIRDIIRNRVERYETGVKIQAEQSEQAASKERKAEQLLNGRNLK